LNTTALEQGADEIFRPKREKLAGG